MLSPMFGNSTCGREAHRKRASRLLRDVRRGGLDEATQKTQRQHRDNKPTTINDKSHTKTTNKELRLRQLASEAALLEGRRVRSEARLRDVQIWSSRRRLDESMFQIGAPPPRCMRSEGKTRCRVPLASMSQIMAHYAESPTHAPLVIYAWRARYSAQKRRSPSELGSFRRRVRESAA